MKIKAVFFDLDGTLLPMDQDVFVKAYFHGLVGLLAPKGYDARAVGAALMQGIDAMVGNDGTKTNEQVFWDSFAALLGDGVRNEEAALDEFYRTEFQKISALCGPFYHYRFGNGRRAGFAFCCERERAAAQHLSGKRACGE